MLLNYFGLALKNLHKQRLYSAINVFGLAVGLSASLMISLFVRYEFSYDNFFAGANDIYRLSANFAAGPNGPARNVAGNVAPLAPLLASSGMDGVQAVTRFGGRRVLLAHEDKAGYEEGFRWADPAFFKVFELDWLRGDASSALTKPDSVVLSASLARRYFGNEDAMGQILLLENSVQLTVTGIVRDVPANSNVGFDLLVPMTTAWKLFDFNYEDKNNWAFADFNTYVRLQPHAAIAAVQQQLNSVIAAYAHNIPAFFNITPQSYTLTAYNIRDIHLGSTRIGELKQSGSLPFVLTFSAIALCLLMVACINYMNLATARAVRRAREVGVRKAIGAGRGELVLQFLSESLLFVLLALLLAVALLELLLPVFGALIERPLVTSALVEPLSLAFVLAVTLLTGLVAGSYPALYLSAMNPARELKAGGNGDSKSSTVRNVLVVVQFFLAIALIVATTVVYLQLQYARNVELGFHKDNVLVLQGTTHDGLGHNWQAFKQQLLRQPGIESVAEADMMPDTAGSRKVRIAGGPPDGMDMLTKRVGFGFFETYGIPVLAGRTFNEAFASDVFNPPANVSRGTQPTGSYILSETAVRELHWTPEQAIGRQFELDFSGNFSLAVTGPVIGVVRDLHFQSLRDPIRPLAYYVPAPLWGNEPSLDRASVRLSGANTQQTLSYIREQWHTLMPELPFIAHFLDTDYAALYQNEARQGQLFTLFAALTVVIACLGLFGLATFNTERRTKEIGVRKVMGGSVWSIVLLFTKEFSTLVLIANVLAWPVAYFAMNRWLQNFAYRIDLTPLIFIGSGLIALCIAWVTVGGTAAKAASQKPVLALRYE